MRTFRAASESTGNHDFLLIEASPPYATEDMRACGTIELVAAYESVLEVNVSAQILELAQASRSSKTL
jgi:hypothetical protein